MSLKHMEAYVITKRSSNFKYNLRVDVQIPALNINHPAGHLLPRPVHHDHYHVHDHNMTVLRPLLLFELLHDSRPMLGASSSPGVELFQVFMGTRLWQDGADQQVFHGLFIPTFARCLSILVESPFLHKGFESSSPCPEAI